MLSYLETENGFIELAKADDVKFCQEWTCLPNSVKLRLLDTGILEVQPAKESEQAIVISCGIHGNETAPIEIVSKLIHQIVTGVIQPKVNLLFILGNPESMKIEDRFITINLNRLFAGAYKGYTVDENNGYELQRAERLEKAVSEFFNATQAPQKLHLDLHTAIKPSYHKTFAIRPFNKKPISDQSKSLLTAMGIEAVLQHNKASTTFSYYSVEKFDAEAYTLELGKVRRFGENNPDDFMAATECLQKLINNKPISNQTDSALISYKVVAEIIRHSDEFKFHVADNVENFTPFPQGYLIAEDCDYNYRVAYEQESVVFPNVNVPIGQRVAVMVARENCVD